MRRDPHGRFHQEIEDFVAKLVGKRTLLIPFLCRIGTEDLDIPKHVRVSIFPQNNEPVGRTRFQHAGSCEFKQLVPGPWFGAHLYDVGWLILQVHAVSLSSPILANPGLDFNLAFSCHKVEMQ